MKDLVYELLQRWRGESPGGSSVNVEICHGLFNGPRRTLNKAEQSFLQRISDLVADANERCGRASRKLRQAEMQKMKMEMSNAIINNRLKVLLFPVSLVYKPFTYKLF